MFHLIPSPLHRLALRSAHRLRHHYRRLFKPHIRGVCVIVHDDAGRVLLVRHSYGSRSWALPGGGCRRREDARGCARRELREELALDPDELTHLRDFHDTISGAPHTAHVFTATAARQPRPDGREILIAQWFDPGDLPPDTSPVALRRIAIWLAEM